MHVFIPHDADTRRSGEDGHAASKSMHSSPPIREILRARSQVLDGAACPAESCRQQRGLPPPLYAEKGGFAGVSI